MLPPKLPAPSEVRAGGQNCAFLGRGICCSPLVTKGGEDAITPNPGVCFEKVSDHLGVLDAKQQCPPSAPPRLCHS